MSKCIGCGSILQDKDINKDGYVDDLSKKLCQRCFNIKYYNKYSVTLKNNDDYIDIINKIEKDDLVLYVTSLLDIRLDIINSFNNVIVVLTKRDILPKSVNDNKLISYVRERYNCLDVVIVSSIKNYNIDNLYDIVKKYNINNNVYIVGVTNSGKSTLVNKLLKNYSDIDNFITDSMYPSTTLGSISNNISGINFIDTPGIINDGSIYNAVDFKKLKLITCKKEIKPRTYQLKGKGSILVDDIFRLDYDTISTSMTIYINNMVNIRFLGKDNDIMHHDKEYSFNVKDKDIVVSDLCFIKFTDYANINVYIDKRIYVYERDNLI